MSSPLSSATPSQVLERDVPFSASLLWRRQRELYMQRGLAAWSEDHIPNFITNNPFIAKLYARMVAAFIDDCGHAPQRPLRVLEIGAGTGKFAYLFLRHLEQFLVPGQ